MAARHKIPPDALGHRLLQPDFLAPDPVPEVEAPERGHGDALVGEAPVEEDGPLLHRQPRPLLERVQAGQEVHVLRAELAHEFVAAKRLNGPERGPTDVLHLIVGDAEPLCDPRVRRVLRGPRRRPRRPESEQQHRLAQLRLMLRRQFQLLQKATRH